MTPSNTWSKPDLLPSAGTLTVEINTRVDAKWDRVRSLTEMLKRKDQVIRKRESHIEVLTETEKRSEVAEQWGGELSPPSSTKISSETFSKRSETGAKSSRRQWNINFPRIHQYDGFPIYTSPALSTSHLRLDSETSPQFPQDSLPILPHSIRNLRHEQK